MKDRPYFPTSVNLDPEELVILGRLTAVSGRNRSDVIKRLLRAAEHDPMYMRALGTLPAPSQEAAISH